MKTGLIIAAIILVLGGGAFVLTRNEKPEKSTTTTTPTNQTPATTDTTQTPSTQLTTNTEAGNDATITYGNNGFSPNSISVKAGATVTIKNNSSRVLQFDSDPHPEHTDNPELNVGSISPGKSATFTATKTGNHGYHNHLNDSHEGTLVVQ